LRFAWGEDYPILQLSTGFVSHLRGDTREQLAVRAWTLHIQGWASSSAGRSLLALERGAALIHAGIEGLVNYDDAEDRFESNADQ